MWQNNEVYILCNCSCIFSISRKKPVMTVGVSNSDLVNDPVLISLEHLTNLEQSAWREMQNRVCLHPIIKAMISLERLKETFGTANIEAVLSQGAHDSEMSLHLAVQVFMPLLMWQGNLATVVCLCQICSTEAEGNKRRKKKRQKDVQG